MAQLYPSMENIMRQRVSPTEGELCLLNFLVSNYNDEYEVYFQPFLNGDMPDIILVRKGGGVMIFEVKDWDLNNYNIDSQGRWKVIANNSTNYKNPLNQVLRYKENLYNIHVDELASLNLSDFKYWYVVNCAVYFHCHTELDAFQRIKGQNPTKSYEKWLKKNFVILGKDSLAKDKMDRLFDEKWISRKSRYFTDSLYKNFTRIIQPSIHTTEMASEEIILDHIQSELATSIARQRKRIKGVAGSGKTLVLAHRAVDAYKKKNTDVLILTYNITLRNYIHDKISQVREEFPWDVFKIANYHDFINAQLNNLCISAFGDGLSMAWEKEMEEMFENKVYGNLMLFDGFENQLPKFSTILIDEAQDFNEKWFRMLMKYFATDDAEIVAFADEKQNVYSRALDEQKQLVVPVQTGPWDKRLCKSFRIPAKLVVLLEKFQRSFFADKYTLDTMQGRQMEIGEDAEIHYIYHLQTNIPRHEQASDVAKFVYNQIREKHINPNDVTILATRIDTLQELDVLMKEISHEKTNVMFETIDEQKKIEKVFQDDPKRADIKKKELRRSKKANFWMNRGPNRLSTVFSFKGWESPVLFLVIEARDRSDFRRLNNGYQPEKFSDELVYTGLTRCKGKLYIINVEDDRDHTHHYDNFFSSLPDSLVYKDMLRIN